VSTPDVLEERVRPDLREGIDPTGNDLAVTTQRNTEAPETESAKGEDPLEVVWVRQDPAVKPGNEVLERGPSAMDRGEWIPEASVEAIRRARAREQAPGSPGTRGPADVDIALLAALQVHDDRPERRKDHFHPNTTAAAQARRIKMSKQPKPPATASLASSLRSINSRQSSQILPLA
jgi:hypothetical protein